MFSNNHHHDGHVSVLLPASPGLQEALIEEAPETYYRPPYVGSSGWIGIELDQITDDVLAAHIHQARNLIRQQRRRKKQAGDTWKQAAKRQAASAIGNRLTQEVSERGNEKNEQNGQRQCQNRNTASLRLKNR